MIHESQLRPKAIIMDDIQVIAEGIPPEEGKFCADCKHLIGVRHNKESPNWNCGHPKNDWGFSEADLVTGIKKRKFQFRLYDLRYSQEIADVCGPDGKWYEKYEAPNYNFEQEPLIGGEEPVIFDEAAMQAGKEAAAKRLADLKARKNK